MDKHQILTPVGVVLRETNTEMVIKYPDAGTGPIGPPMTISGSGDFFDLKDKGEVFTFHFPSPFERVDVKASFTLGIAIEYRGNAGGIISTLGNLCQHARRIVEEVGDALD